MERTAPQDSIMVIAVKQGHSQKHREDINELCWDGSQKASEWEKL